MDANGAPIPFSVSAFGEPLPLQCPQCLVEHTNWKQTVPFNKYGDHVNLRSRFSNRYMVQHNTKGNVSPTKGKEKNHFTSSYVTDCLYKEHDEGNASMEDRNKNMRYCIESLRQKMEYEISTAQPDATGKPVSSSVHTSQNNTMNTTTNNNSNTLSRARTTNAYYCGLCHRRLLRFGAEGELIPLSCDEEGRILPMRCPGCGVEHSDWELKGFAAGRMFLEGDTVVPRRG
ncbi:hypothetical protein ADEAN_000798500 [Angomonas deanei]|uniref:Uncharacterized protein n=1 Tax=Angomonas deanei TaxID=59799 RepID=A0A7G2CPI8_9TRYP|nr:hypothetical protein ADEAN_000798500 [Angomonas deanei]